MIAFVRTSYNTLTACHQWSIGACLQVQPTFVDQPVSIPPKDLSSYQLPLYILTLGRMSSYTFVIRRLSSLLRPFFEKLICQSMYLYFYATGHSRFCSIASLLTCFAV